MIPTLPKSRTVRSPGSTCTHSRNGCYATSNALSMTRLSGNSILRSTPDQQNCLKTGLCTLMRGRLWPVILHTTLRNVGEAQLGLLGSGWDIDQGSVGVDVGDLQLLRILAARVVRRPLPREDILAIAVLAKQPKWNDQEANTAKPMHVSKERQNNRLDLPSSNGQSTSASYTSKRIVSDEASESEKNDSHQAVISRFRVLQRRR